MSARVHHWFRVGAIALVLSSVTRLPAQAPLTTADGFAIPQPGRRFEFPRDHGAHREFRVEWWYLTGHLDVDGAPRFGFQATFFRQAAPDRAGEIHLAHMALVDRQNGRFYQQERLNREGWDAEVSTETLDVRNGPWTLRLIEADSNRLRLHGGTAAETAFTLDLVPLKPLVIFGEDGVSRKGADPTAASHYLTFSRLAAKGTVTIGDERLDVSGEAWMDHEISSSQLSAGQVGWDWVSIQLHDGREVMLYRLRRDDGSADPASSLTWIAPDATLARRDFTWIVDRTWKSPRHGASYPANVRIQTVDPSTDQPVTLHVEPVMADQEWRGEIGGIPYWEGACRVRDASGREIGRAYMELTGYAKPLAF